MVLLLHLANSAKELSHQGPIGTWRETSLFGLSFKVSTLR